MNVIALIPARGGSKRIPNKNIKLLNGKPLIAYSIELALKSPLIERVIVSTDSMEIARIAKTYNAEVPFLRPSQFAGDTVGDFPVFKHLIDFLKAEENYSPDIILNLRPTAPLRNEDDIRNIIDKFTESNTFDSVRSVTKVEGVHHPYWMFEKDNEGLGIPVIPEKSIKKYYQSQLLPPVFRLNGVVDGIKTSNITNYNNLYGNRMVISEIPESRSHDIDTLSDFQFVEFLMSKNEPTNRNR